MTDMVEDQAPASAWEGAGAVLRRERESQGLSIFDAARALRLSEKQVAALEADDYAKLPGRTFVRGFIRNYARLLQLDPEPLLAHLALEKEDESRQIQAPSQKISFSEHQSKPWLKWLLMAFVIVSVFSWGVLQWLGPEQANGATSSATEPPPPQPSAAPPAEAPPAAPVSAVELPPAAAPAMVEAAPPAGPAVPASAAARLSMSFTGRAWVEVRDRNGKIIHSQNNVAGADQVVEGEAPLSLVIGSAPNVKLIYKGQQVDLSAFAKADVARLTLE